MIDVSVVAGGLVVGRRSPLSIKFANTGGGPCVNVVFKLRLPPGIVLMSGSDWVEIAVIPAGRTHVHEVTVEARRPGRFELSSTNFSYRDEFDMSLRVTDIRADLVATPATAPAPVKQPVGRLGVRCEGGELDLGAWDVLRIMVTNGTGVALRNVVMAVNGPFTSDGKRSRIAILADGATAKFSFHVNAAEVGRHVPVTVRTTYDHQDSGGAVRTLSQEDNVNVTVRPATPGQEEAPAAQTILYLAASPRNMPPLRSDVEMRNVKERLRRSKHRDRYRIELQPAVRFEDISQALIDYEPHVVHFSGHGDKHGNLCVEDEYGNPDLVTPEGLAELFGQHKSTIRCVVLNACFSVRLAEALAERIDHVVGMRYRIGDEAAIEFSAGFYPALFGGLTIPKAFERGRACLLARPAIASQHLTPLLFPPIV